MSKYYRSFTEVNINKAENNDSGNSTENNTTTTTDGNSYSTANKADNLGTRDDVKKAVGDNATKEQLDTFKNNMNDWLKYYSAILGAKLSFGQTCYKDYMTIIRAHVRTYAKPEDADATQNKKTTADNTDIPKKETPAQ